MAEDMAEDITVIYEGQVRRLILEAEEEEAGQCPTLYDLSTRILELFKLNGYVQELEIRFVDKNEDAITVANDEDVVYAFDRRFDPLCLHVSLGRTVPTCSLGRKPPTSLKIWGPFGGGGGTYWSDGNFLGVIGITVTVSVGLTTLYSIQVTYATGNDETYAAPRHGGGSGKEIRMVFKYPTEKLQKISGYCELVHHVIVGLWSSTVVKSISFETSRSKYGPFGVADWIPFELGLTSTNIVGFYGRASANYLDSIGVQTRS